MFAFGDSDVDIPKDWNMRSDHSGKMLTAALKTLFARRSAQSSVDRPDSVTFSPGVLIHNKSTTTIATRMPTTRVINL